MPRNIYKKILDNVGVERKMIAMTAYAFYKEQKNEYLSSLDAGADISEELNAFYRTASLETQIEKYINDAETFVEDFASNVVEITLEKHQEEFQESAIIEKIESLRPSFFTGVFQSTLSSILLIFITGIIIFFTWAKDFSLNQAIEAVIDNKQERPKGTE